LHVVVNHLRLLAGDTDRSVAEVIASAHV